MADLERMLGELGERDRLPAHAAAGTAGLGADRHREAAPRVPAGAGGCSPSPWRCSSLPSARPSPFPRHARSSSSWFGLQGATVEVVESLPEAPAVPETGLLPGPRLSLGPKPKNASGSRFSSRRCSGSRTRSRRGRRRPAPRSSSSTSRTTGSARELAGRRPAADRVPRRRLAGDDRKARRPGHADRGGDGERGAGNLARGRAARALLPRSERRDRLGFPAPRRQHAPLGAAATSCFASRPTSRSGRRCGSPPRSASPGRAGRPGPPVTRAGARRSPSRRRTRAAVTFSECLRTAVARPFLYHEAPDESAAVVAEEVAALRSRDLLARGTRSRR